MSDKQATPPTPKDPQGTTGGQEIDEVTEQVADESTEPAGDQGTNKESGLWDGIPEEHPIRKEFQGLRQEAAARRVENKELKESLQELEQTVEGLDSVDDLQAAISEANRRAEKAQLDLTRVTVGHEHRLPEALHSRLQGKTPEEITEDAKRLQIELGIDPDTGKSGFQGPPKPPPAGGLKPQDKNSDAEAILANLRKGGRRLGVNGANTK